MLTQKDALSMAHAQVEAQVQQQRRLAQELSQQESEVKLLQRRLEDATVRFSFDFFVLSCLFVCLPVPVSARCVWRLSSICVGQLPDRSLCSPISTPIGVRTEWREGNDQCTQQRKAAVRRRDSAVYDEQTSRYIASR
jgi:hypothetical protein